MSQIHPGFKSTSFELLAEFQPSQNVPSLRYNTARGEAPTNRSRFSEEQIVGVLKEGGGRGSREGSLPPGRDQCCYVLPLEVEVRGPRSERGPARRLRQLEDENERLKDIVEQPLDIDALKVALAKKW